MAFRLLSKVLAAGAAVLALSGAAQAAQYELTFTGTNVSGDVFLSVDGDAVTGVSGTVTDSEVGDGVFTITGLSGFAAANNLFYADAPYFDYSGLAFTTDTGGEYNLASYLGVNYLVSSMLDPSGVFQEQGVTAVTIAVSSVPEPATAALALSGLLLVAARRRSQR